jgi:ATP-dependent DNA helicase HFM1/MER3
VLGHVHSLQKAKVWLKGTFLFVRLQKNPKHYQLADPDRSSHPDDMVNTICESSIKLLQDYDLVTKTEPFRATAYGNVVAQYYVQIETARVFLDMPAQAKISEIVRFGHRTLDSN